MTDKKIGGLLVKQYALTEAMKENMRLFKARSPTPSEGYIKVKLEGLMGLWKEFKANHEQLYPLFTADTIKQEDYFKSNQYAQAEDAFCEFSAHYADLLPPSDVSSVTDDIATKPKIKIPVINVPTFNGNIQDWHSFRNLFRALIHDRPDLSDVEKLQYLKGSVQGEANQIIKHFDISGPNYKAAWQLLVDRYDNTRIIVEVLLTNITSLPSLKSDSIPGYKNMVDTVNESTHSLNNLNVSVETWDPILLHLLVPKLPPSLVRDWEKEIGSVKTLPTLSQFLEFLTKTFQVMETSKRISAGTHASPSSPSHKVRTFLTNANTTKLCPMCNAHHSIRSCTAFRQMTVQGRLDFLKNRPICRNCLSLYHSTQHCPSPLNCRHCQRRHHSSLHIPVNRESEHTFDNSAPYPNHNRSRSTVQGNQHLNRNTGTTDRALHESSPDGADVTTVSPPNLSSHAGTMDVAASFPTTNLLATATLYVSYRGNSVLVRALLDPGSQATFVTSRIVQILRAATQSVSLNIAGIGGVNIGSPVSRVELNIGSRLDSRFNLDIPMLVLPKITQLLPPQHIYLPKMDLCRQFTLADPHFDTPGQIDMLLGVDVFAQILMPGLYALSEGLRLQESKLGWIIFGSTSGRVENPDHPRISVVGLHTQIEDDNLLKKFWELEAIPSESDNILEQDPCDQHYQANTKRLSDGRYEVKLPFRDETPPLGQSGHIAKAAFIRMERRLLQSPTVYQQYQDCFDEYLTMGHMKPASIPEHQYRLANEKYRCYYMPHHSVMKESSTTKLRVVFNASQKTNTGNSLNDVLYTGPRLQSDIATILVQWRLFPIAFTADIAKMYRQIKVHPSDHAYQRILWRASPTMPIVEYELETVTFGVTTAPYLALRTLRQLVHDDGDKFPLAAQELRNNFYVDDYLGGSFDIESAREIVSQLRSLLRNGGFNLRKWVSNCVETLANVCIEDRESLQSDDIVVTLIKTLGVGWNPTQDILQFNVPAFPANAQITKRSILSWIAGLFDPLGCLAPLIIPCKIFLQRLWLAGLQWDDYVGDTLSNEWKSVNQQCQTTQPISIPRWCRYAPTSKMELHGFCDASKRAYAAALYLRVVNPNGVISCRLLLSKTRVAPTKTVTIPRLELCGAVLLIKVLQYLRQHLSVLKLPFVLWTDSQVVLAWLRREPNCWTTFVANRVAFIQTHSTPADWSYVRSSDNPADVATRGLSATELATSTLWWSGPSWLSSSVYVRPPASIDVEEELSESAKDVLLSGSTIVTVPWLNDFSSLTRLLRVTAYIRRFVRRCKSAEVQTSASSLSSGEILEALHLCVRVVQQSSFGAEIHTLVHGHPLHSKSPLLSLNPLIDKDGILRVGGRLANSDLAYSGKHPILLPSRHHFTTLVIRHAHAQTLHGGMEMTAAYIRATYWILHSRSSIRKILHTCTTCFRYTRRSSEQMMADLPRERVTVARPFTYTGVDYAGPVTLKTVGARSTRTFKGYIAVFVCFTVKAFHLELVSDLTKEAFLAAFHRFIARRGLPHTMFSDCGTNFVGAQNLLTRQREAAIDLCANRGVEWKFIPPASPHFGGLWEAGVKLVKNHLKRILGATVWNFEEYSTLLTQIEACLNSRPLWPITDDARDYSALTPGHFLTGSNLVFPPQPDHSNVPSNYLHRWQRIQQLYQLFWRRWSTDYLSRQQPRPKWKKVTPNLQENELVLIRDERLPPLQWRLGRVISTTSGTDKLVRVATVRTADGLITRPITKLFKLPLDKFAE